jgi:hypothetical protein
VYGTGGFPWALLVEVVTVVVPGAAEVMIVCGVVLVTSTDAVKVGEEIGGETAPVGEDTLLCGGGMPGFVGAVGTVFGGSNVSELTNGGCNVTVGDCGTV